LLNVHFHSIVLEGVYTVRERDGAAVFHPVRAPTTEEVAAIAGRVAARVLTRNLRS
jgi:Putative transposase